MSERRESAHASGLAREVVGGNPLRLESRWDILVTDWSIWQLNRSCWYRWVLGRDGRLKAPV